MIFAEAETNYQAAIAILEKHAGFLSMRLVNPLVGLGETYIRGEQYVLATEAYEKALHINHVNEGFYNPEQTTIRDGLTEGYLGLQDIEQANLHQDAQVYAKQRRLGANSPEVVDALTKLGRWYERSGQAEQARLAYQNAARLLEKTDGDNAHGADRPAAGDRRHLPAAGPAASGSGLNPLPCIADVHEQHDAAKGPGRGRAEATTGPVATRARTRRTRRPLPALGQAEHGVNPLQGCLAGTLGETRTWKRMRDQYFAEPSRIIGPDCTDGLPGAVA